MVEPRTFAGRLQGQLAGAALSGTILAFAAPALAAPLQVVVDGAQNTKGSILVAICTEREFLSPHCTYNAKAKAHPGPVTVTLEVPPGTYAAQAFHDEDDSGEVTMNMLGLPTEALGFSNNVVIRLSAPRFRDAAFQLGPMGGRIAITLKHMF